MKFSPKLFCILLIAAGMTLPACKKKAAPQADAGAAAQPDAQPAAKPAAKPDTGTKQAEAKDAGAQGDAAAKQADAGAKADAAGAKKEAAKKAPAKPAGPAFVGVTQGNVGGAGITKGHIRLFVTKDYKIHGSFRGQREGQNFNIPLSNGHVSKSNTFKVSGSRGKDSATAIGKVTKAGVSGSLNGKIFQKPFSTKFSATK